VASVTYTTQTAYDGLGRVYDLKRKPDIAGYHDERVTRTHALGLMQVTSVAF